MELVRLTLSWSLLMQETELIPEGHRGLHEYLYGDAEDHGASGEDPSGMPMFNRDTAFGVNAWLEKFGNSRVAAVYAVLDRVQNTRFVGITRNLALSLKGHQKAKGDEAVDSVRIQGFRFPKREEVRRTLNCSVRGS